MSFDKLFKQIPPDDICQSAFKLVGENFGVATSGKEDKYNSMIVSGGGMGFMFKKPAIWLIFRRDRYTLEIIKKEHTYTISYFENKYNEQILFLGSKSGRDSNKMKDIKLSSIKTPSGNISFKEARLVIECKLIQVTTPSLDDFYAQEAKDYLKEAYKEPKDYRQYVFGEIINVWIRK